MANLNPDKWRQDSTYTQFKIYILNSIEFEGKLTHHMKIIVPYLYFIS
jgi:hypothetical protein